MKVGENVTTSFGLGVIVALETYSRMHGQVGGGKRYGVALDTNPFGYSPVYFWADEIWTQ